jgi:tetratricopeptide (TPR) repeat protein
MYINNKMIRFKNSLYLIAILVISISVYGNTIFNGFVSDDNYQILRNVWIKDPQYITDIFFKDVWGFYNNSSMSNYYRPIMYLIFMINYHIFGLNPWGFHLVNILFHAGNSILVFLILSMLFKRFIPSEKSPEYAFIGAILFSTHPIHTEAVAWISAVPELSYTFFFLLSLYSYMLWREAGEKKIGFYLISLISFVIAIYSKEPALVLPLFLFLYDLFSDKDRIKLPKGFTPYVPFIFFALFYLYMRFKALEGFAPVNRFENMSMLTHVINIFPLFAKYLEKLLLPLNLNSFYVYKPIYSIFSLKVVISLLVTLAFIASIFLSFKRNKLFVFSLVLIIVPLMPVLYAPFLGFNVFTERYLYLPSVGFVMFVSIIASKLIENKMLSWKIIVFITVVLTSFYSVGTIKRNVTWKDDYTLSLDRIKKSPESPFTQLYYGSMLLEKGDLDNAFIHLQTALRLNPPTPQLLSDIYVGIAIIHLKKGMINDALNQLNTALRVDKENPDVYMNLGEIYLSLGNFDEAIKNYNSALMLDKSILEAYNNLGIAYGQKGLIDQAIRTFEQGLKIYPEDFELRKNLERAYELKTGVRS